jgi:hypothetical protein
LLTTDRKTERRTEGKQREEQREKQREREEQREKNFFMGKMVSTRKFLHLLYNAMLPQYRNIHGLHNGRIIQCNIFIHISILIGH